MKRICTVCARGGSEGVPGKNIRPLLGKPLIAHTLEQALDVGLFERVAVSSDSADILGVAEEYGDVETIERPEELATSESAKLPAIQHAVSEVEDRCDQVYDTVVDLDATAPIREVEDIRNAVQLFETTDASNVITGVPARKSPYFNLVEKTANGYVKLSKPPDEPIVRRQDTPECFDMNASIYVWGRDAFFRSDVEPIGKKTRLYEMEEHQAYDIDSEIDFVIVEAIMDHTNQ
ncbi:cytidylyltransferase domain-containing protein [Salinibacter ruber]|uniref:acylneuraminate cytidylyltransferase family protein n=1 Tax=Salinibacter ruber TaxID=146919 RepID=UPI002074A825|nr:acylneuraminate cytidylyltransferase family protein [Salinibacter ruber]